MDPTDGVADLPKIFKSQKVARVTNNGYLNFLTVFKKAHSGFYSPRDMVRLGAQAWNTLPEAIKQKFKKSAKEKFQAKNNFQSKVSVSKAKRVKRRQLRKK